MGRPTTITLADGRQFQSQCQNTRCAEEMRGEMPSTQEFRRWKRNAEFTRVCEGCSVKTCRNCSLEVNNRLTWQLNYLCSACRENQEKCGKIIYRMYWIKPGTTWSANTWYRDFDYATLIKKLVNQVPVSDTDTFDGYWISYTF